MKKMFTLMSAVALFTGCNNSNSNYIKKEVSINGTFFGETKDSGYEKGYKLYSTEGAYVGFVDTDNIVYQGTRDDPNRCGGEYVGFCESTSESTCNVPNFERVTYFEDGGVLIPPAMAFSCGERL